MATVYIAPTAQGSADGTSAANAYAFSSLATAENDAGSGGTLYFLDGTYSATGDLDFNEPGCTWQALNKGKVNIDDNGSGRKVTIYGSSSTTETVKDLKFTGTVGWQIGRSGGSSANLLISGCSFYGRTTGTAANSSSFFFFYQQGSATFEYSDFEQTTSGYFATNVGGGQPFVINSCTIFNSSNGANLNINVGTTNGSYKNVIFKGTGTNSSLNIGQYCTNCCFHEMGTQSGGTNNLFSTDPQFVDAPNGDYRLRPSSPCIGAATAS
jgi:hypothetical protein